MLYSLHGEDRPKISLTIGKGSLKVVGNLLQLAKSKTNKRRAFPTKGLSICPYVRAPRGDFRGKGGQLQVRPLSKIIEIATIL